MPRTRNPEPPEFKEQIVELARPAHSIPDTNLRRLLSGVSPRRNVRQQPGGSEHRACRKRGVDSTVGRNAFSGRPAYSIRLRRAKLACSSIERGTGPQKGRPAVLDVLDAHSPPPRLAVGSSSCLRPPSGYLRLRAGMLMITKAIGKKINPNVMTERLLIWMRTSKNTAAKNARSTSSKKPL